jgi:mannonate dehydratase
LATKIALHVAPDSLAGARFARQLGLRNVVSALPAAPQGYLALADLQRARAFFAEQELSFDVIENLPTPHYHKAMFGLPGRDEQIANVCRTIRNMGLAGIGVLQYQWMLLGGLRTEYSPTGRGGARVARFDLAVARRAPGACMVWRGQEGMIHFPDRELPGAEVWEHLLYFLRRVLPVAEEAGVKLCVHPDDPPMPSFLGVARIMTSLEAFQRLFAELPSPNNGLGFCQGTISAIPGVDVVQAIRHFGAQKRIFFAHFRNSVGALPRFDEVFPDEGDTDLYAAVRAYREVGFDGLIRIDHTPGVIGDNDRGDRGFAFQVGYMKGLVHAAEMQDAACEPKGGR